MSALAFNRGIEPPIKLDPREAEEADIYGGGGRPLKEMMVWLGIGFGIILCPDCGEIDEEGEFFEPNTVYSTWGDPHTCTEDDRCNLCKCWGFLLVGI